MTQQNTDRNRNARGGFTLIEVLLVVAILGILATIVAVNMSGKTEKAQISAARASIGAVCTAIDLYEVDTGRFPPGLQALVSSDGSPNWSGPYVRTGGIPKDPWGKDLGYSREGERGYRITSGGPDMAIGGADDITN